MKKLIVLVGPNGVGKSTTAMRMKEQYSKTAFVDSDWCRSINPFILTDITKKTVTENLYCLLRNYLLCEEINTVIFTYSWHGERKEIYNNLIQQLQNDGIEFKEIIVILKCSESENRRRALLDNRNEDRIKRGIKNTFSFYNSFQYPCIDTTDMAVSKVVEQIWKLANNT